MSMLSECQGSGNTTEARPQPEDTAARIDSVLQQFDVLSSRGEKQLFRSAYRYFFGDLLLSWFLLIASVVLFVLLSSSKKPSHVDYISLAAYGGKMSLSFVIVISVIVWTFNVWREYVPQLLRGVLEKKRIDVPTSDVNTHYLEFLEQYRDALRSPRRHLLIGNMLAITLIAFVSQVLLGFYSLPLLEQAKSFVSAPLTIGDMIFLCTLLLIGLLGVLSTFGFMYYLAILIWALSISGWYIRKLPRAFEFRIEPVHPDKCGGLKMLGNFCFSTVSPLFIGSVFCASHIFVAFVLPSNFTLIGPLGLSILPTVVFFVLIILMLSGSSIFAFFLPLWEIHTKMLKERERAEEIYAVRIATLQKQIQVLLDDNQLEEAKAVKEKKELMEALYIPSPTWPFNVRAKLFSTVLGAGGSFLLGFLTAMPPVILQAIFKL